MLIAIAIGFIILIVLLVGAIIGGEGGDASYQVQQQRSIDMDDEDELDWELSGHDGY